MNKVVLGNAFEIVLRAATLSRPDHVLALLGAVLTATVRMKVKKLFVVTPNSAQHARHLCINCLWSSLLFVVLFVVKQAQCDHTDAIR